MAVKCDWCGTVGVEVFELKGGAGWACDPCLLAAERAGRELVSDDGGMVGSVDAGTFCPVCGLPFVGLSGDVEGCPVHGIREGVRHV